MLIRFFRRLFCKHTSWAVPVLPMVGQSPWAYCEHCGKARRADYDKDKNFVYPDVPVIKMN
jgi:hypothetical protein